MEEEDGGIAISGRGVSRGLETKEQKQNKGTRRDGSASACSSFTSGLSGVTFKENRGGTFPSSLIRGFHALVLPGISRNDLLLLLLKKAFVLLYYCPCALQMVFNIILSGSFPTQSVHQLSDLVKCHLLWEAGPGPHLCLSPSLSSDLALAGPWGSPGTGLCFCLSLKGSRDPEDMAGFSLPLFPLAQWASIHAWMNERVKKWESRTNSLKVCKLEGLILNLCWICFCDFNPNPAPFVSIHNGLPQGGNLSGPPEQDCRKWN